MSRRRVCICTFAAFAVAGAFAATCSAASAPPKSPLLFDPLEGSIGGVRLRESMSKLVQLFGPPDRIVHLAGGGPISFWLKGKALCTAWAEAYPETPQSHGVVSLWYRGPVRTRRGDRLGTPSSIVRKHWRGSWQYLAHVMGGQGPNYGHIGRFGSATFGFDGRKRLAGVGIQTSEQIWQPIIMPACQ
jgi:hypothetical protein